MKYLFQSQKRRADMAIIDCQGLTTTSDLVLILKENYSKPDSKALCFYESCLWSNVMFAAPSPSLRNVSLWFPAIWRRPRARQEGSYGTSAVGVALLLTLSGSRMLRCTRQTISFTVMSMGTLSGIEQVTVSAAGEPTDKAFMPTCKLACTAT